MVGVPADEARDTGEQTVTLGEEHFVAVCDLYDAFDVYLSEISGISDQPLDYSAAQEELALA
jgi:hypothetical protein